MINKPLGDLAKEKEAYEGELAAAPTEEEKAAITKNYVQNLRMYLYETKMIIKETFGAELTPFQSVASKRDGMLRKNETTAIVKKTKAEFFGEIDRLIKDNSIYLSLDEDKKQKIDTAFYVLKTYYENELI